MSKDKKVAKPAKPGDKVFKNWNIIGAGETVDINRDGDGNLVVAFKGFTNRLSEEDICEAFGKFLDVIKKADDGAKMFLAFLKGDGLAALTWADEVQALAVVPDGELFMPRASIEKSNGVLAEAYGNRGAEIRRVYEMLKSFVSGPETNFPLIREAMAALLKELRRNAFL